MTGLEIYFRDVLGVKELLTPAQGWISAQPPMGSDVFWQEQKEGSSSPSVTFFHLRIKPQESLFEKSSWQLLSKMIQAMKLSADDWQVMEILLEQEPTAQEQEKLRDHILKKPGQFFVSLGANIYKTFCLSNQDHQGRGHWLQIEDKMVLPTYSSLFLLQNPKSKAVAWQDLKKVMEKL